MGIVTSARREDFELIHAKRGITEHIEYGRSKPHPDPHLKGLERFGGERHEAVVVEDLQHGLRSAVDAGIECVVVHNHFTVTYDFSDATHRIKTLHELEALL